MSDKMDELDRLKAALKAVPVPAPEADSKARIMAAAMAEFAACSQGSAEEARPKVHTAGWLSNLIGRVSMQTIIPSLRPYYYGGASLAVMTLAILSTGVHQRGLDAIYPPERPAVVELASQGAESEREEGTVSNFSDDTARPGPQPRGTVEADQSGVMSLQAPEAILQPAPSQQVGRSRSLLEASKSLPQRVAPAAACSTLAAGCDQASSPKVAADDFESRYVIQPAPEPIVAPPVPQSGDQFAAPEENPVKLVAEEPVSTFSIDVDTASYAFTRRALMEGRLPPQDAVRVEEMVNYFAYDYAKPTGGDPFAVHPVLMPTPWNAETQLLRIALQGEEILPAERPRANLVFLVDTSGSMQSPDKLGLLVNSLRMLLESMNPDDTVGIVTYAGQAGVALEPTPAREADKIVAVLDRLRAGGSTAGAAGIEQAYALAERSFVEEGVNRVILATDGDFNVGLTDRDGLQSYVERKRESGVMLSVMGFGQGNYNDALMQTLAQNGNGQAAYIDTLAEARKVLVEEASSALYPIARDVKIQVEFNPAVVAEYRLIGYETRALNREDFNNDKVDAGEIGSGHRVTALYEITPVGSAGRLIDDLRYGAASDVAEVDEIAFLKLRYKAPGEDRSKLITRPITAADAVEPDSEARFAAAVAGFAQVLRGGRYTGDYGFDDVLTAAGAARGADRWGYRAEFLTLVRLAKSARAN